MEKIVPKIKNCSKCGKAFECLHNKDCWCMDYVISPENLQKIQETYADCLCSECLKGYATAIKPRP
jgi:ribosomal protein L34E